jgi:phospholipase/carboxylesterase
VRIVLCNIFLNKEQIAKNQFCYYYSTGGNEHDLLSLADIVDSDASVLSVRGNVLENGMPRFFKRLAEAAAEYKFDRQNIVAIGYSNGANIAASLLFHLNDALKGAILHHPMVPRPGITLPDLTGIQVFIASGINDPICPQQESVELQ